MMHGNTKLKFSVIVYPHANRVGIFCGANLKAPNLTICLCKVEWILNNNSMEEHSVNKTDCLLFKELDVELVPNSLKNQVIDTLRTKRNLFYSKTQFVLRSKHSQSLL